MVCGVCICDLSSLWTLLLETGCAQRVYACIRVQCSLSTRCSLPLWMQLPQKLAPFTVSARVHLQLLLFACACGYWCGAGMQPKSGMPCVCHTFRQQVYRMCRHLPRRDAASMQRPNTVHSMLSTTLLKHNNATSML